MVTTHNLCSSCSLNVNYPPHISWERFLKLATCVWKITDTFSALYWSNRIVTRLPFMHHLLAKFQLLTSYVLKCMLTVTWYLIMVSRCILSITYSLNVDYPSKCAENTYILRLYWYILMATRVNLCITYLSTVHVKYHEKCILRPASNILI